MVKFSIIVPVYKTQRFLNKCIDSIINQTYRDFEVILVDDGSPDKCPQICDSYAKRYEYIKVIHKNNEGLVKARISGTMVAVGEYITFVDSDDYIAPTRLETVSKVINQFPYDVVCTGFTAVEGDIIKRTLNRNIACAKDEYEVKEKVYGNLLSMGPFFGFGIHPSACMKFIKKELLVSSQKKIPAGLTWGEDLALTYPCILSANSVCSLDDTTYMYVSNVSSMTHTYDEKLIDKIIVLIDYIEEFSKKMNWENDKQLQDYIALISEIVVRNEFSYSFNRKSYGQIKKFLKNPIIKKYIRRIPWCKNYPIKLKVKCFLLRFSMLRILDIFAKTVKLPGA